MNRTPVSILAVICTSATTLALLAAPALSRRGEVIDMYDCSPGYVKLGDGPNYSCIPVTHPYGGYGGSNVGPGEPPGGGGGGTRVPDCRDCQAEKERCKDAAEQTLDECGDDLWEHFARQCSVHRKDVFGRGLNPRRYDCEWLGAGKERQRVCRGPAISECLDEAAVGASLARVAQVRNTTVEALSAAIARNPSLTWSISKQITNVENYNIFEGIDASCTALGTRLVLECQPKYASCLEETANKKAQGSCK